MGVGIRERFANLGRADSEQPEELNRAEVQTALDRLTAYDPPQRVDRRRPLTDTPALRRRSGMWKR